MVPQPHELGIELEGYVVILLAVVGSLAGILIFSKRFLRRAK